MNETLSHSKDGNTFLKMIKRVTKKNNPVRKKIVAIDLLQPSRYKPSDLNQMVEQTKFTKGN